MNMLSVLKAIYELKIFIESTLPRTVWHLNLDHEMAYNLNEKP